LGEKKLGVVVQFVTWMTRMWPPCKQLTAQVQILATDEKPLDVTDATLRVDETTIFPL
jgi:hypothetical protein